MSPKPESLAGEVVVVDTGSTDDTVQIARQYGARVLACAWEEDFSKPRNLGLEAAASVWFLVLDADEELAPECAEELSCLVGESPPWAYLVTILNFLGTAPGREWETSLSLRLFHSSLGYRYKGAVHEQPVPGPGRDVTPRLSSIRLNHYGYLTDQYGTRGKGRRNLEILRRELEKDPGNRFLRYNLGISGTSPVIWPEPSGSSQRSWKRKRMHRSCRGPLKLEPCAC